MSNIVYHASNHLFERPDYESLIANRTGHDNGALGLWCAVNPGWIGGFGQFTYAIEYTGKTKHITINDFSRLCTEDPRLDDFVRAETYFRDIRDEMLADGTDILAIVEQSKKVDMLVILNLKAIHVCNRQNTNNSQKKIQVEAVF